MATKSVKTSKKPFSSLIGRLQLDLEKNNSYLNIILGVLIVVVVGILIFNYFKRPDSDLGPSQTSEDSIVGQDVSKEALPGNYTVKEGDTLFQIAQKYYDDGYKYDKIVQSNKLANENLIVVGQVLTIPKLDQSELASSPSPKLPDPSIDPTSLVTEEAPSSDGKGGAENQTIWGEKITSQNYTVQSGDWLSKIAGRAYGDIYQYQKIATANNIPNPDNIEVGMVLKIPR